MKGTGVRWVRMVLGKKICEREKLTQNVLWLHVTVKDPVTMHVIHSLDELPNKAFHHVLLQVVSSTPNLLVDVHVHQLKDEGKTTCRLVIENLVQLYDELMGLK